MLRLNGNGVVRLGDGGVAARLASSWELFRMGRSGDKSSSPLSMLPVDGDGDDHCEPVQLDRRLTRLGSTIFRPGVGGVAGVGGAI